MVPPITQYFVNWIDGMKLSREHFVAEQNAITARLRDTNALGLSSYRYGILPPLPNTRTGLDVKIISDRFNSLAIRVSECRGITPGGQRIEISESNQIAISGEDFFLEKEVNLNDNRIKEFLVVISVNPLQRTPVGLNNPEENPPRNPFASETYFLNVLPEEDVIMARDGLFHLTIGKLKVAGSTSSLDENYIPPVVSMSAHPDLIELVQIAEKKVSDFEDNVVQIIQKIFTKKQSDDLPQTALEVCRAVRDFLSQNMFALRTKFLHQSPVEFFEFFSALSRTMKNALDSREGSGKEQFLSYVRAWVIETSQAEFEYLLESMISNRYNHMDINQSVVAVQNFSKMIFSVFAKLAELDFIGDKKQRGPIDIDQRKVFETPAPQKRGPML